MIEIRLIDRKYCPNLCCDHCGHDIDDSNNAMVTWDDSMRPRYLHKGRCDTRRDVYWCSLDEHLLAVASNVGVDVVIVLLKLVDAVERDDERKQGAVVDDACTGHDGFPHATRK